MTPADPATDARRVPGHQVAGGTTVKLSPGGVAELLNVSATGALVESRNRLAAGTKVVLAIGGDQPQRLEGEVLRSTVAAIHRDSTMTYQLAIAFGASTKFSGLAEETPSEPTANAEATPVAPAAAAVPVNEW